MKVGDISHDSKMILSISDKCITVVPIKPTIPVKITTNGIHPNDPRSYSEFEIDGRKKFALLWLTEEVDPKTNFTPVRSVSKEVCDKIIKDYLQNYYGMKFNNR